MVLYKRKQVQVVVVNKLPQDLSTEVWYIPQTKEWFLNYEDYLARMDYYQRRKFVCEITGNSCLTFFEALESETKEVKDVERNFPEALKGHILRFLQFNRITRLDQLVDKVYSQFKNNYFPGEYVLLKGITINGMVGELSAVKQRGLIREKVEPSNAAPKYLVVRLSDNQQAIATSAKVTRDRNHFTKWLIKTFIKLTMARSHRIGAPWVVKDKYAKRYRIPQEYPPDLKHFEASTAIHDDSDDADPSSMRHFTLISASKKVNIKFLEDHSARKKDASKPGTFLLGSEKLLSKKPTVDSILDGKAPTHTPQPELPKDKRFPIHYLPDHLKQEASVYGEGVNCNRPGTIASLQASGIPPTKRNMVTDLNIKFDIQNSKPTPYKFKLPENSSFWNKHLLELIEQKEELNKEEQVEGTKIKSESSQVITISESDTDVLDKETEEDNEVADVKKDEVDESLLAIDKSKLVPAHLVCIEQALECWSFLNIYHSPLKIDTFTFDDFIYSMGWNYEQFSNLGRCELLDEIWCSVLSAIVSNRLPSAADVRTYRENGEVYGLQIKIPSTNSYINPSKDEDEELIKGSESDEENNSKSLSDGEDDNDSDSEVGNKEKPIDIENNNVDSQQDGDEADDEQEDEDDGEEKNEDQAGDDDEDEPRDHNAYQIMNYRGTTWHDRLRRRNFRDGNWQTILLGVLSLVDNLPKYEETIDRVYKILGPLDQPATTSTTLNQFYKRMDINLRIETLNILCELLSTSDMVRSYIDRSLEESTVLRRKRLDNIKEYKLSVEKAQGLHNIIYEKFLELNMIKVTEEELKKRPRFELTQFEMSQAEAELAAKDSTFADLCEQRKQVSVTIDELKREKKSFERQLVERDCQRVRCLGKDRLYNRYWWFENNGLPTLHGTAEDDEDNEDVRMDEEDDSSDEVQEETYLMGKLWVQGPSQDDVRIHLKAEELKDYHDDSPFKSILKKPSTDSIITDYDNNIVKELDFREFPRSFLKLSQNFGLNFSTNSISKLQDNKAESIIIDKWGGVKPSINHLSLSPMERKIIEECPDPLFNGSSWRYYDSTDDIENVIKWLNPYGVRESQLKKELIGVKDAICFSIEARNKALSNHSKLEQQNKLMSQMKDIDEKLAHLSPEQESEDEEDDEIDFKSKRKRKLRTKPKSKKRQKSFEDIMKSGTSEELQQMKENLEQELRNVEEKRESTRALEWVNATAIELFDKSLYDGGDRYVKSRGRK
ncbi:imitation switch two complex protein 1 [Yamadazyma tenuis]|uniref:imitation switch two complex protein 1 n=1 Tax=Candida tenuis TaxID=2315449 RepID=UPI0027A0C916|nr:imitation switch two complex protein 1 [Yamadazyma tenuis]